MKKLFAQQTPDWIGTVSPPIGGKSYEEGLVPFINNAFKLLFIAIGFYALLQFVLAAYDYINAEGDKEKTAKAQRRITFSVIGLVLMALTFIFAGLIGQVFFGDWNYLLDINTAINQLAP